MALPTLTVTPQAAVEAYRRAGQAAMPGPGGAPAAGSDFGSVLERTVQGVADTLHGAETAATRGLAGQADVTEVVAAVSKAELALQTTATLRDRVVQAYQDIMKMPI